MAASDASQFIVKNQAYRLTGLILNGTTGNEITGGLTALSASVSKDGASTFTATSNSATEQGTTGWFYVDLTATEMNANTICVRVTASNSDAVYFKRVLIPVDLSESSTHWMKQTVKRLEQGILQMASWFVNKTKRNNSTGTITVRNVADSADVTALAVNETSGEEVKASWS